MKKVIIILSAVIISLITLAGFSRFFVNLYGIVDDKGYFIPQESNMFIFKVTKMNEGSGEWWLYGEDNRYYYGLNVEPDYVPEYFKLKKGNEPENFDKWDYHTWGSNRQNANTNISPEKVDITGHWKVDEIIGLDILNESQEQKINEYTLWGMEIGAETDNIDYGCHAEFREDKSFVSYYAPWNSNDCTEESNGTYEFIDDYHIRIYISEISIYGRCCDLMRVEPNDELGVFLIVKTENGFRLNRITQ